MKLGHLKAVGVLFVIALACAGCGGTAQPEAPDSRSEVALPDWAPEEPSVALLRAAAAVRPIPTEGLRELGMDEEWTEGVLTRLWPACYEFLGSMSDEQIETLTAREELRMPYSSLTSAQKAAFERWMEAAASVDSAVQRYHGGDYRAFLSDRAVEEDLSNLDVGFGIHDGGVVGVYLWILPESLEGPSTSSDFALTHGLLFEPAPDFSLTTLEGETLVLSDLEGQVVLLDFWATWCPPCREEIPGFIALQEKYGDRGLIIVGVSVDKDGRETVAAFVEDNKINYPIAMSDGKVEEAYGPITGIPTTFLIEQGGRIVGKYVGYHDREVFEREILAHLDALSGES
jgi:thiol-disulfide isomerase/thioredoxin